MSDTFKLNLCPTCMEEIEEEKWEKLWELEGVICCPYCGHKITTNTGKILKGRYLQGEGKFHFGESFGLDSFIGYDLFMHEKVMLVLFRGKKERQKLYLEKVQQRMMVPGADSIFPVKDFFWVADEWHMETELYVVMDVLKGDLVEWSVKFWSGPNLPDGMCGMPNLTLFMSTEACMRVLKTFMKDLQKLHERGFYHGGICAESFYSDFTGNYVQVNDWGMFESFLLSGQIWEEAFKTPLWEYPANVTICEEDVWEHLPVKKVRDFQPKDKVKGPWTDVYALCVLMFNMFSEDCYEIFHHCTALRTEFDFSELIENRVNPKLVQVLEDGLTRNSKERIQNAGELLRRIEECGDCYRIKKVEDYEAETVKNPKEDVSSDVISDEKIDPVEPDKKSVLEKIKSFCLKRKKLLAIIVIFLIVCLIRQINRFDVEEIRSTGEFVITKHRGIGKVLGVLKVPDTYKGHSVVGIDFEHISSADYKHIYIGENVKQITGALGAGGAKELEIAPNNPYFIKQDEVVFTSDMQTLVAYSSWQDEASYQIPESIKIIGAGAFFCCENLRQVTFPESLQQIERFAFFYCTNLKEVKLPLRMEDVGYCAFDHCESLSKIMIPRGFNMDFEEVGLPEDIEVEYY